MVLAVCSNVPSKFCDLRSETEKPEFVARPNAAACSRVEHDLTIGFADGENGYAESLAHSGLRKCLPIILEIPHSNLFYDRKVSTRRRRRDVLEACPESLHVRVRSRW